MSSVSLNSHDRHVLISQVDKDLMSHVKEKTSFSSLLFAKNVSLWEKTKNIWLKVWTFVPFSKKIRENAYNRLETKVVVEQTDVTNSDLRKTIQRAQASAKCISGGKKVIQSEPRLDSAKPNNTTVSTKSVIQAALEAYGNDQSKKIAIIDLASADNVCGAYFLPSQGTQEEDIAVNSPLVPVLDRNINHFFAKELPLDNKQHIPLDGCVYIADMPILRGANKELNVSGTLPLIDIIAVAALDGRKSKIRAKYFDGNDLNKEGQDITKQKMRSVLEGAKESNVKYLILGAMGCGAYKNPPETIAKLWKEVIIETGSDKAFDKIEFAIFVVPGHEIKDNKNIQEFQKVFSATTPS